VIGATTTAEYRKYLEKDAALERRFQPILVREPSVEESLAILRGLKDKYEAHHGVRIRDAALVAAAELSDRYISGRFLPDKAIDLIDEATSSLRLEIQSRPEVIDKLARKERQLEVELRALKSEAKGKKSQDLAKKIKAVQKKLSQVKEDRLALEARWQKERQLLKEIKQLKLDIEALENQAEIAETQEADLDRVAEIRYGKLPAVKKELAQKQAALAALDQQRRLLKEEVTASDIARVVARATGVPVEKMLQEEATRLALMEEVLRRRVVGQDRALEVIADVIRRSRVGLAEPGRPLGVFLFVGPTGVGKTETAKALAEFLFGSDHKLLALDMSEFSERHSVAKLIGAPPGYVGYGESGRLLEKVRREPYQVVLFDEIEKAHPEVYNILLQLMDEGRLTDGQGRTVDFSNTVVIMTSNLAGEKLLDLEETEFEGAILEAVRHHFRPEFLNRIDEIVIFKPLTRQNLEDIIELQLQKVGGRLKEQGLDFEITPAAKRVLAQQAYSRQYGARPLQRVLKQAILNPLSRILVEKKQGAKDQLRQVKISLDQDQDFKVECR
jgi:ATP-dependent Clp protease ATP-binding subunit ClpB